MPKIRVLTGLASLAPSLACRQPPSHYCSHGLSPAMHILLFLSNIIYYILRGSKYNASYIRLRPHSYGLIFNFFSILLRL